MSDAFIKPMLLDLLQRTWEEEQTLVAGLSADERATSGAPERRSAKDVVAHIASWRERHVGKLADVMRGATPPRWTEMGLVDRLNAEAYAEWRQRSWQEVLDFAGQAYAALVGRVESLSEAELADPNGFPVMQGESLWPEILGNGAWHPVTHLIEYANERGDTGRVAHLRDVRLRGQELVLQALERTGASQQSRAEAAYDLACLAALTGRTRRALDVLREAVALRPDLALHAKHDADFASLRPDPAFQALTGVAEVELIAARALREEMDGTAAPVVVDVRDPDEYAAGHVQGAVNIPLGQLSERMVELSSGQPVATYCNMQHRGISRGERAAILLREGGFPALTLDGGYPAWKEAGLPVEKGPGA